MKALEYLADNGKTQELQVELKIAFSFPAWRILGATTTKKHFKPRVASLLKFNFS